MNLSSGGYIKRRMVYKIQPRKILSLSIPDSAVSLVADIIYFLWMESIFSNGLPSI